MASLGSNINNKNGVAMMEKPNPVLVCNIDANNMMTINNIIVISIPPRNYFISYHFDRLITSPIVSVTNLELINRNNFTSIISLTYHSFQSKVGINSCDN
jgi:hypothetical protein